MSIFPKFRLNKPRLNKKQKKVLGKELGLDKFLTQAQLEQLLGEKAETEQRQRTWNSLSPKMKVKVGEYVRAHRKDANARKKN